MIMTSMCCCGRQAPIMEAGKPPRAAAARDWNVHCAAGAIADSPFDWRRVVFQPAISRPDARAYSVPRLCCVGTSCRNAVWRTGYIKWAAKIVMIGSVAPCKIFPAYEQKQKCQLLGADLPAFWSHTCHTLFLHSPDVTTPRRTVSRRSGTFFQSGPSKRVHPALQRAAVHTTMCTLG